MGKDSEPPCRWCPSGHTGPKHDAERAFDAFSPEAQKALQTPLGGPLSAMTLTEDEWEDMAAIARSYIALCRQQMAAPGRYTDLDLAIQKRRRALAERVVAAAAYDGQEG